MKHLITLNPEQATPEEIKSYSAREATRAIVLDDFNNLAILHVNKDNYYKLPGGGIEKNETKLEALKRECLEEVGCDIEILNEIGIIVEHRKIFNLNQTSYCYLTKVIGSKGKPQFTQEEINKNFELLWLPYDQALTLISANVTTNTEGHHYIVPRDSLFVSEAIKYLNQN